MIRYIKIALAAFASLFCLFYALQNIANLGSAEWFVGAMTAMEGHEAYPNTFAFAIKSPKSGDSSLKSGPSIITLMLGQSTELSPDFPQRSCPRISRIK